LAERALGAGRWALARAGHAARSHTWSNVSSCIVKDLSPHRSDCGSEADAFSGQSPAPRSQSHRSLTGASSRPRALQSRTHRGMDELRDIAAQARDLAYQSGRDEVELLGRRHEDVVDPIRQVPAHRRELELELEIGDGAQTSHDDRQVVLARELDREPSVAGDLDAGHIGKHFAGELD